jgi:chorismate mutase
VKKAEGIPMMQPERVATVRSAYAERGRELGVSPDFMTRFAVLLIDEACRLENEIIDEPGEGTP